MRRMSRNDFADAVRTHAGPAFHHIVRTPFGDFKPLRQSDHGHERNVQNADCDASLGQFRPERLHVVWTIPAQFHCLGIPNPLAVSSMGLHILATDESWPDRTAANARGRLNAKVFSI